MGKPFKVSTPALGPQPPVEPTTITPMQVSKEAERVGRDVAAVGRDHQGPDGETPIPWPAAQPVTSKPFKLR